MFGDNNKLKGVKIMKSIKFNAILAKNGIARELKKYKNNKNDHIGVAYIESMLEDIEKYIGEGNQPSVKDIMNSNYDI